VTGPLNYTTTIAADKTAGECLALLGRNGAAAISIIYEDKQPAGIVFLLATPHGDRRFRLPVNVGGVYKSLMQASRKTNGIPLRYATVEHARRVAWRVAKDWLEAQLAIIGAQMVTIDEAFLPYLEITGGQTVYEAYRDREQYLALEAGQ
jgi:hypothetical protein